LIALEAVHRDHFNALTAAYPMLDLLSLPLWKWAALVEHWAFTSVSEDDRGLLEADLDRSVNFSWLSDTQTAGPETHIDPWRWQQNRKGESLLSVHRKRQEVEGVTNG